MLTIAVVIQMISTLLSFDIHFKTKRILRLPESHEIFHIISKIKAEEPSGNLLSTSNKNNNLNNTGEETYYD